MKVHKVTFGASGRGKARCAPDPAYPHGVELDVAGNLPSCTVTLIYPAPECGHYLIECVACTLRIAVTVAGRPDDPTAVKLPCLLSAEGTASA